MSRANDLVPALHPPVDSNPPVKFRQGTIISWDSTTGENVVSVGGGNLFNVSILNTAEAVTLRVGHVVGLLTWGTSWFIIGRITVPGDPDFASASVGFESAGNIAAGFAVSTLAPGTIVSAELPVPSWADEALVSISVNAFIGNPRTVADFCNIWPYVDETQLNQSTSAHAAGAGVDAATFQGQAATWNVFMFGPFGGSITVSCRAQAQGGTWAAVAQNFAYVSAHGIFRSTV